MTLLADKQVPAPAARSRQRRSWRELVEPRYITLAVAALVVAYLALALLGTTPGTWTFQHYADTFSAPGFGQLVLNSFLYAGATAVVCTVFGFGLAWLVVRTNTPAKGFARVAALVPLIVPGILNTVAWSLLLSPERGPINVLLWQVSPPLSATPSLFGQVLCPSMSGLPVAYLVGTASFRSIERALCE